MFVRLILDKKNIYFKSLLWCQNTCIRGLQMLIDALDNFEILVRFLLYCVIGQVFSFIQQFEGVLSSRVQVFAKNDKFAYAG